jgi:hypothetical protein
MKSHTSEQKCRGALWGLYIGDALSMPVHWYYNRSALHDDYGWVTDYLAPKNPHPDSLLFRSNYSAPNPKGEILHDQVPYWGREGTHYHYHQFLTAGENTLNLKLCRLLIQSLNECGGYDAEDYLRRYISFMIIPGNHRDTYIEVGQVSETLGRRADHPAAAAGYNRELMVYGAAILALTERPGWVCAPQGPPQKTPRLRQRPQAF